MKAATGNAVTPLLETHGNSWEMPRQGFPHWVVYQRKTTSTLLLSKKVNYNQTFLISTI